MALASRGRIRRVGGAQAGDRYFDRGHAAAAAAQGCSGLADRAGPGGFSSIAPGARHLKSERAPSGGEYAGNQVSNRWNPGGRAPEGRGLAGGQQERGRCRVFPVWLQLFRGRQLGLMVGRQGCGPLDGRG